MRVLAGQNLQAALDAATPGDPIELEAGATWTGNYTISRDDTTVIGGSVVSPGIVSLNGQPAIRTVGAPKRVALREMCLQGNHASINILQLGDGLIADVAQLPRDITIEDCWIEATGMALRGIQMNAANVTVRRCSILGIKTTAAESQSLVAWNSPGPFLIEDNHIEAAAIGILFGGAVPAIPGLIPSDITIRDTTVTRPLALRSQSWGIKNLLELKNAQRVSIAHNIFEHNWPQGQAGWGIVFTVRANGPNAPWTTIQDVEFAHNIVRHSAMGVNILGLDNQVGTDGVVYPSTRMRNVAIRNNLFYGIDHTVWGGTSGAALQIAGGPEALAIERNTFQQTGNILSVTGAACPGFRYVGNVTRHNNYGIFGESGTGNVSIARHFPGGVIEGNVIAGGNPSLYPARNVFLPSAAALTSEFVDPASGNYRLRADSILRPGVGVDQDALEGLPSSPSVLEHVAAEALTQTLGCGAIGGDVSPQGAAIGAIERYRLALVERLA